MERKRKNELFNMKTHSSTEKASVILFIIFLIKYYEKKTKSIDLNVLFIYI